jgi:hypothetical protein
MGINLATADTGKLVKDRSLFEQSLIKELRSPCLVIVHDLDFNPHQDMQVSVG